MSRDWKDALLSDGYLEQVQNPEEFIDDNGRLTILPSLIIELMEATGVLQFNTDNDIKEFVFRLYLILGCRELLDDYFISGVILKVRFSRYRYSEWSSSSAGFRSQFNSCRSEGMVMPLQVEDLNRLLGFKAKRRKGISRDEYLKKFTARKLQDDWAVFYDLNDFRFFTSEYPARRDFIGFRGRLNIPKEHIEKANWYSCQVVKEIQFR